MPAAVELAPPAMERTSPATTVVQPSKGDVSVPLQTARKGPKTKKSKSLAARGPTALPKSRGTGFEEYYAEPPLTVEEFEEEMDLYNRKLPFDERIETCLQRYRARRRLDNERSLLLNRYLSLGGIDCQPRQFNGTADLQRGNVDNGLSKSDARTLSSTDIVTRGGTKDSKYYNSDNASLWTVDFTGVVSGYLSQSLPALAANSEKRLTIGIDVVDNFLRYLQIHDVCPEYADDIKEARAICVRARTELPNCFDARLVLPGQFNLACVQLFYKEPAHKVFNDGLDPLYNALIPDIAAAKNIFRVAMALKDHSAGKSVTNVKEVSSGSGDDVLDADVGVHILVTEEADLEITRFLVHMDAVVQQHATLSALSASEDNSGATDENKESDSALQPIGLVVCKYCTIEEGYANQPRPSAADLDARGTVQFPLDTELMKLLCVGTKLRVVLHHLSCGETFVSTVKDVLPSFYTFLPQELMMDWKEPRKNERNAPSVQNPDADADEEKAHNVVDED